MHFSPLRHTKTGIEGCNDIIFYVYFSMRCFKTANLQFWRAEERPSHGFREDRRRFCTSRRAGTDLGDRAAEPPATAHLGALRHYKL